MPALTRDDRRALAAQVRTRSDRRAWAAFSLLLSGWTAEQVQGAKTLALIQGVPDDARAAVQALLATTAPDADYPLSHFPHQPLSHRGLVKLLDRWGRRAGVGSVTLRRISLTRIVLRMEAGVDLDAVAAELGITPEAVALRIRRNGLQAPQRAARGPVPPPYSPPVYRVPLGANARR